MLESKSYAIKIGDAIEQIKELQDSSVHAVITDPPYNVKMANWDAFPTNKEYGAWCENWATECLRVLKPGGAMISFSGARTYHWLACGIESAGFVTRDMIEWIYWASFAKGKNLKPGHEPIYYGVKGSQISNVTFNIDPCRIPMSRKQRDAIEKWLLPSQPTDPRSDIWSSSNNSVGKEYNAIVGKKEKGWVHTSNPPHPDGRVPYNVLTNFNLDTPPNFIDVKKPRGKESISEHPTQKPLKLMMWLINLTTNPGDTILDPFGGSGTTGEAALLLNRTPILIERDPEYADVIDKRLTNLPNQWVLNEQLKASEDTVLQSLFEF